MFLSIETEPKALEGILKPNNLLESPDKFLLGQIFGAETLIARNEAIFATLDNGDIIKIVEEKISVLGNFKNNYSEFNKRRIVRIGIER